MDWSLYWFMFPVAIGVATTAMLSGIGGAALFIPIIVIVFPLLGPEYPLTTAAAIGTALLTQVFGFLSGFIGYYRKGLIDFRSAVPHICIAVPVAIAGALMLALLKEHETFLKGAYGLLMIVLCPVILKHKPPPVAAAAAVEHGDRPQRAITAAWGKTYRYPVPRFGMPGGLITGAGAFLTGLLGVGIGEVIVPQLVKLNHVPLPVAAATSVFAVIVTVGSASFTQVAALMSAGGIDAVPWNLVCYTVPAVIIGGQIGPWLQGRVSQKVMERTIAVLLGMVGVAMMWIVIA